LTVKRKFSTTYSLLWITISVAAVLQGIFPQVLNWICRRLGIGYPPTLVLALGFVGLLIIMVYIASELAVAQNKIRELSIHISLLNDEMMLIKRNEEFSLETRSVKPKEVFVDFAEGADFKHEIQ